MRTVFAALVVNRLNLLLIAAPISWALEAMAPESPWIFLTSAIALVPLAGLLGLGTRQPHLRVHVAARSLPRGARRWASRAAHERSGGHQPSGCRHRPRRGTVGDAGERPAARARTVRLHGALCRRNRDRDRGQRRRALLGG